ncbi:MAG: 3-oxoacyl-[acyl-carrier-protein] reductase [Thermacetogeniaceae bacterium]|jgi:3-oxoacyl-[acyl-carrier protein] reductase|nr:3-oxoacyl-[acyl-carrier-protein] reductase [Syntrophomonadaceae bacterium]
MRDEVALITGGARGIGKAIALRFAQEGYKVAVCDLASKCDDVVQKIKDKGGQALGLSCDITDPLMVKEMIDQIIAAFGRLDVLVNNAGIAQDNLLPRISDEEWLQTINTNLTGTFYCTRAAIRPMLKQKKGRIINISSVVGLRGNAGQSHYAASKAGIIGFTKAIAREYGSRGITANAVAPGYIQTDMTAHLPKEYWKDILNSIPLKRPGTPEDIAGVVAFLASADAAYITGQVIAVDGGLM